MKWSRKQILLLFILVVIFTMLNSSCVWKKMYPIKYTDEVRESSRHFQVDPFLTLAIIQIESNFQPQTVSKKGAIGLMQLMPETANWAVYMGGFPPVSKKDLNRPEVNIGIGCWYLSYLDKAFNGNRVAVVAAYNAGPGNVRKWLDNGVWDGRLETISHIPFGETRHFVQRVMYYYGRYVELYKEEFTSEIGLARLEQGLHKV